MHYKSSSFAFICRQFVSLPFCSLQLPVKRYQPVDDWVKLDSAREATGECAVRLPTGARADFDMDTDVVHSPDERQISASGVTMCIKDGRNSANGSRRVPVAAEWMGFSFVSQNMLSGVSKERRVHMDKHSAGKR